MDLKKKLINYALPCPVDVRHSEYSMLFSMDDEKSKPSERIINLALESVKNATQLSFFEFSKRIPSPVYTEIWPGEHYKLLAGMVQALKPKLVIEIGTFKGMGSLALKYFLPPGSKIITFDIIEWDKIDNTILKESDFNDGSLVQIIDDLSQMEVMQKHSAIISKADFLFIDAAKDGEQEQKFLDNFKKIVFEKNPIMVFDDIRLWNMLKIWREIDCPKLDITSFGHWSGTGIVDWK